MKLHNILIGFGIFIFILYLGIEFVLFNSYLVGILSQDADFATNVVAYVKGQDVSLGLTEREELHMQDVRALYQSIVLRLLLLCIVIGIVAAIYLYYDQIHLEDYRQIILGVLGSQLVTLVTLLISALSFSQVFVWFHRLAFDNDLWILPANSTLIQTFPESFFLSMVFAVFLYMAVFFVGGISLYWMIHDEHYV